MAITGKTARKPGGTGETATATTGQVIGENLKRLRKMAGFTQSELADTLGVSGTRWTRSHIAAFEAGNRETIDLGTLVILARTMGVPLAELFAGEGVILLGEATPIARSDLRVLLGGQDYQPAAPMSLLVQDMHRTARERYVADAELAGRLGVHVSHVVEAARALWGHSLHEERDQRIAVMGEMTAGQRATRRGHVTRALSRDIEHALGSRSGS